MSAAGPQPPGRAAGRAPEQADTELNLCPLDDFVGFALRVAQDASFRAFAKTTDRADLKPGWFAAMMVIHNNPGLTQVDLSRSIARDKSSVTPLIQGLERRGLVERRPSRTDRRRMTLRLTAAGEAALQPLLAHAMEHDRKLDGIVGDQKAAFIALLKKVADEIA